MSAKSENDLSASYDQLNVRPTIVSAINRRK
jgi:hypothetical protein